MSNEEEFEEQFDIDLNWIKCPYCHRVLSDVYESMEDDDCEIECYKCNKTFIVSRSISYNILKK
jgi:hypothetical protein